MIESIPDLIVGSGPTGYAAALALTTAGRSAVVMDFGADPASTAPSLHTIASKPDPRSEQALSHPRSLVSGATGRSLPLSSARGGLSLVWGAAVLERSAEDCPEVAPVFAGIRDGYELLREHVPLAGDDDRLSLRFPWAGKTASVPASSRFAGIRQESRALHDPEVLVGSPRVAMNARGCTRCGLCLAGCPENLFFDARRGLEELPDPGLMRYLPGPALALAQEGDSVTVTTPHGRIRADRVHLAAGPIGTPALLQRSGLVPDVIEVQDSAVFYVPIINRRSSGGDESDYTAAQLLVASTRRGLTDFTLAVYESNPDFRGRLARLLRVSERLIPFPSPLRARINAGIGFLSTEKSGSLRLRYMNERTWVDHRPNAQTRPAAVDAARRASRGLRRLGLHPVASAVMVPSPGQGFHSGGGLPLGGDHVDWNGVLRKAPGIRILDASALPRIWAGSHTYTAMANAVRTVVAP